jgi:hypothetical protein
MPTLSDDLFAVTFLLLLHHQVAGLKMLGTLQAGKAQRQRGRRDEKSDYREFAANTLFAQWIETKSLSAG